MCIRDRVKRLFVGQPELMSQLVDADLLRQPLLLPFIHVVCADTHIRPLFSHIATPGPPSPTQAPVRTPASGPFGPFPSAPYSPGHEGPVRTIYGLPPGQHSRRKSGTTTPLDPGPVSYTHLTLPTNRE